MDRIAVLRFILALSYWCHANTQVDISITESLPTEWCSWLVENQKYFDLFGTETRFMQTMGLKRVRPVTDLIHEVPSSTNHWHFRHVTDYIDGLCPSCCILGILRLPVFTTIGGRGFSNGINGCPPIYSVWWESCLSSTLYANWAPTEELGIPAWLMELDLRQNEEVMLLTGLTLAPRKLYLPDPNPTVKQCANCGSNEALVYYCHLENNQIPDSVKWNDPHVMKSNKDFNIKSNIGPLASEKKAFLTRDWYRHMALLMQNGSTIKSGNRLVVGFTSDQNNYLDVWELTIKLDELDTEELDLYALERWQDSINDTLKKKYNDRRNKCYAFPFVHDIITYAEDSTSQIRRLLRPTMNKSNEVRGHYKKHLRTVGQSITAKHTVAGILGRMEISSSSPIPKKDKQKTVGQENQ